jgi:hypothetical protein
MRPPLGGYLRPPALREETHSALEIATEPLLNTGHVSGLKLLFLSAKIVTHSNNRMKIKCSGCLARTSIFDLFEQVKYLPNHPDLWADSYSKFADFCNASS